MDLGTLFSWVKPVHTWVLFSMQNVPLSSEGLVVHLLPIQPNQMRVKWTPWKWNGAAPANRKNGAHKSTEHVQEGSTNQNIKKTSREDLVFRSSMCVCPSDAIYTYTKYIFTDPLISFLPYLILWHTFTSLASLLPPRSPMSWVQRLPTVINFYHVAKAAAETHSH